MNPDDVLRSFREELSRVSSPRDLEGLRIRYLGKKGIMRQLLEGLKNAPPQERKELGRAINEAKSSIEKEIEEALSRIKERQRQVDLTLPGRELQRGNIHPLRRVYDELVGIFVGMGFSVETGPEIEWDWYNFEALNIPKLHPARDLQDTMYITDNMVMRTHTSPVQIRAMQKIGRPPIRIIAPGKVYRRDPFDASHSPCFNQMEGLAIDVDVSFAGLKSDLTAFARAVFGPETQVDFIPSYYPFTEPSADMVVKWKGRWMEILGSGMVHPQVLRNGGIDPELYTGYAFGFGVDRIAMIKYGIDDIRLFFENDRAFLEQIR
ncbi:MAG: phenylalanine--tRNA ligase subunit alpha [candidate division WOR-3 bacterium]